MKKKILLLILSTFIIKGADCTSYLVVNFCPSVEEACFMNMLDSNLQDTIINSAFNCSIIQNAISGAPDLNSLQNNASKIVEQIVKSYLLSYGTTGCDTLVQTYLKYSTSWNGTIMQQCSNLLGGSCSQTIANLAQVATWGLNLYNTVAPEAEAFGNAVVSDAKAVGNAVVSDAEAVGNAVEDVGSDIGSFFSSW